MSYLEEKLAPIREDRLGTSIEFGGNICQLKKKFAGGCLKNSNRGFCQGSICQLLPGTSILSTIPDSVIIIHGSLGCGGAMHSQSAAIRGRQMLKGNVNPPGALWLTTDLDELDVVNGGEEKLEQAIIEADRRYRPASIIVVATCVPGIIGDDIDGVAERLQDQVSAVILPIHCEGFKTKSMATAYDAIYHSFSRKLLDVPKENRVEDSKVVNLLNVSSMNPEDERELTRLLNALGLKVNIYPCFTHPENMKYSTQANLSISTCPTHDDYFLKHLQEKYGIPYVLQHMPIGIENTNLWLREIAKHFNLEKVAEKIIEQETIALEEALLPFRQNLKGKKALLSSGEIRTLATAVWLQELGLEIIAVRPYHYDKFGEVEIEKLAKVTPDLQVNVATVQPFETVNIIEGNRPDIYLGHNADNVWAAKSGIPVFPIYGVGNTSYVGYTGAFDIAKSINRILKNSAFNRNLRENIRQPYYTSWYQESPFKYITAGGNG